VFLILVMITTRNALYILYVLSQIVTIISRPGTRKDHIKQALADEEVSTGMKSYTSIFYPRCIR
jgi:hypothetical protein